jgi:hypothetical protein
MAVVRRMPSGLLYLVPSESHLEVALREGRAAFTFRSFLERLTAGLDVRPATLECTRLATALALEEMHGEPQWEGGDAFVRALDEALGALHRAGMQADAVRTSSLRRAGPLARLLEQTGERLAARGVFDPRALGWVAARTLDRDGSGDLPSSVVVDGIHLFDPSQLAWIEALARRTAVTVRMPRGTGPADALLSTLEGRWHSLESAPDLELYEIGVPADITIVAARTDGAEARAIARAVSDALRSGAAAERIAIVLPDADDGFFEPLSAALEEARVPFHDPPGRPPAAAPAVSAALAWLDLAAGPLDRDTLIDLLHTRDVDPAPFVEGPTLALRRHRALSLARRLANIPVRTDRDGTLLAEVLSAEIAQDSDERWMPEALARIARARADLAAEATRERIAAKLASTWRAMGLAGPPLRSVAAFASAEPESREAGLLAAELRDQASGFRALLEATERVAEAAVTLGVADAKVPAARFRAELQAALSDSIPSGGRRPFAVRIARATEVMRLETDLLIVARANEGSLDAGPPDDSNDAAAANLALSSAIGGARRLVMTRSESDADGRPTAPAALWGELASKRAPAREPASRVDVATSPLSARGAELRGLALGRVPEDDDVRRRVAIERDRLGFFLDPRTVASRFTGAIENASLRDRLRAAFGGTSARPIAATAIERAAQCKFSAFAGAVLGASSADAIGEALEPWQKGSLVHRALFIALDTVRRRGDKVGGSELVALASAAAKKALVRDIGSPLYRAEVERALRAVAAVVEWSLEDDADFRFAHGERSFGEARPATRGEPSWPSLAIGIEGESVYVKGRIDRVDFSPDGSRARVIDYKTGTLPAWKDVGTIYFQPPLYSSVVLSQMGPLSVPEVRGLYLDTSRRPPRPLPMEKSQVFTLEAMRGAERRAASVVVQLWNGKVAPRPADAAICGRCDARDICRRPAAMPVDELEPDADGGAA